MQKISLPCPIGLSTLLLVLPLISCQQESGSQKRTPSDAQNQAPDSPPQENKPTTTNVKTVELFDGRSLEGWEITNFGGEGDCRVENGVLVVEAGYPISGVTTTREDLPTTNYELALEARKTEGIDFFCGLTFPVADSHCSFIVGGWAGAVVGLSCIDGEDASTNETRKLMRFENDRWYRIRVRVEPKRIQAWIDDEQVVDLNTEGRKISLRNETLLSRPLGICNFETTSEFKNIQLSLIEPQAKGE